MIKAMFNTEYGLTDRTEYGTCFHTKEFRYIIAYGKKLLKVHFKLIYVIILMSVSYKIFVMH